MDAYMIHIYRGRKLLAFLTTDGSTVPCTVLAEMMASGLNSELPVHRYHFAAQ